MQNLKFKQLLILSNSTKSANQFKFSENLNLITATDNSVGKSTLVKLLFWGLGCEPVLDTNWNGTDSFVLVEFCIGTNNYVVKRYKTTISLKENDLPFVEFTKITNEYSKRIAEILGFKALLPNRENGSLETPPPVYYFLPFYIDQKRSWANAWDNFEALKQFENWKSTIIKYHIGLLPSKHFELEVDKGLKKDEQKNVEKKIEKIGTAIEVIESLTPKFVLTTVNQNKLNEFTNEIKNDLSQLQESQEVLLDKLTQIHNDRIYLEQQKLLTEKIIIELDKDYKFTIENIVEEEIECPLCGTAHENSVVHRTSIMTDKNQAENQLNSIQEELTKTNNRIRTANSELDKAREEIAKINEKYIIEEGNQKIGLTEIIEQVAGSSIRQNIIEDKKNKMEESSVLQKAIKGIGNEQRNLLTQEYKKDIEAEFVKIFKDFTDLLKADEVNLSKIKSPLDYNNVIKEGGAAEGARAILAYYLTIFSMVEKSGNKCSCALVIDTPNQHEQSQANYDKIVDLLTNKMNKNSQIILCAMENDHLKIFKEKATIITLDSNKLLHTSKYEEVKKQIELFD